MPDNGWTEWSKHVLLELKRLDAGVTALGEKMDKMRTEIAVLKVKAGVWGAVAGMVPVAVYMLMRSQ